MTLFDFFDVTVSGQTAVLVGGLTFEFDPRGIGDLETRETLYFMERTNTKNVVIDCRNIEFGAPSLKFFVKLYLMVSELDGRIVFCNVPDGLRLMMLPAPWAIYDSRTKAIAELNVGEDCPA